MASFRTEPCPLRLIVELGSSTHGAQEYSRNKPADQAAPCSLKDSRASEGRYIENNCGAGPRKEVTRPQSIREATNDDSETREAIARPASSEWLRRARETEWDRWRLLGDNKEFVWETWRLKYQLTLFLETNPAQVRAFFSPTFFVTGSKLREMQGRINRIDDDKLKRLLKRYVRYVLQYGVMFRLNDKPPYFRVETLGFPGNRFHAVISQGQLKPAWNVPNEIARDIPSWEVFESDEVEILAKLNDLYQAGMAKYLLVDDMIRISFLYSARSWICRILRVKSRSFGITWNRDKP
jgi:hypothetical protein